jgi:hypothetical protein
MPGNKTSVFKDSLSGPYTGPWANLSMEKENKEADSLRKRSCEQETQSVVGLLVNVPEDQTIMTKDLE